MIRTTRWSPDTCGCVLEYAWDDTLPADERVHTFTVLVAKCPDHIALLADQETYDQVLSENTRKNHVLELARGIVINIEREDYVWSFNAARRLRAEFPGMLTGAQKAQLRQACNNKFGAGKVEVI